MVCAAVELVMLYGDHLVFYVFILRNNSIPAVMFYFIVLRESQQNTQHIAVRPQLSNIRYILILYWLVCVFSMLNAPFF